MPTSKERMIKTQGAHENLMRNSILSFLYLVMKSVEEDRVDIAKSWSLEKL